ncbi:hypothetical protein HK100_008139 [Physocladia obscura]|uniref:Uncharacterized protein n=1 Tax=Physocladia obscura TaxID=109957 RepID=A0AAD5T4Y1_9FUNG|nr:hypothetical protein HK100_008139 [Physocladia obscura]
MHKVLCLLIFGSRDEKSTLRVFQRDQDALRAVFVQVCLTPDWIDRLERGEIPTEKKSEFRKPRIHAAAIKIPVPATLLSPSGDNLLPPPIIDPETGNPVPLQINMMPFLMSNPDPSIPVTHTSNIDYDGTDLHKRFQVIADSLPENYKRYAPLIAHCLRRCKSEWGKVGYLTVHESWVEAGATQRRPGLHVESPGAIADSETSLTANAYHRWYCWGAGKFGNGIEGDLDRLGIVNVEGGIFLASNTDDSFRAYDCVVEDVDAVGHLGDISHMRDAIAFQDFDEIRLKANELLWITDRTPHESLPQKKTGFRQLFRLVTSGLSLWYQEHNTPNELGILPGCDVLKVKGNKFTSTLSFE